MGQGGWDGERRDGGTEVEVQVWLDRVWTDDGSAYCPAAPKKKRKEKEETTTASTDSTDFT